MVTIIIITFHSIIQEIRATSTKVCEIHVHLLDVYLQLFEWEGTWNLGLWNMKDLLSALLKVDTFVRLTI